LHTNTSLNDEKKSDPDKNYEQNSVINTNSNSSKSHASAVSSNLPPCYQNSNNVSYLPTVTVTFHVYVPPFLFDLDSKKCEFGIFGKFNDWKEDQMKKLEIVKKFKEGLILSNTFEFELPWNYHLEYKYLLKYENGENKPVYLAEYLGRMNENRNLLINAKSINNYIPYFCMNKY